MNKAIPLPMAIAIMIVIAAGGFFGGTVYGKGKTGADQSTQRGRFMAGQDGARGGVSQNRMMRNGNGFTSGDVIKQDESSITMSLPNGGGSKVVYFGASTTVDRSVSGSIKDVKIGDRVMVVGSLNSDGSLVAQTIQIRPQSRPGPIETLPGRPGSAGGAEVQENQVDPRGKQDR